MQFKIEKIILILVDNKKRELVFHDGVNIISGKSQTGKSALIDIIDYCLFSSSCTIPQGVISKNVKTYCILVWINNRRLILARNQYDEKKNAGSTKIYFEEKSESFNNNLINADYFRDNHSKFVSIVNFKEHIKRLLGLTVDKVSLNEIESVLSFRSMTSFMFQDQNLMASKHTLFYRLDSFKKVKQTQRDLKVFLDIQDVDFLKIDERLEQIKRDLKQIEKDEKFVAKKFNRLIDELKSDCIHYYALYANSSEKIEEIAKLDNSDILNYKNIIEEIKGNRLDSDIPKELFKIEEEKDNAFNVINKLLMQLEDIKNYEKDFNYSEKALSQSIIIPKEQTCPLCNSRDINDYSKYEEAKEKIKKESESLKSFQPEIVEEKVNIETELERAKEKFKKLNSKFKKMQKDYKSITKTEEKKERLLELKTKILANQEFLKELKKYHEKDKVKLLEEQKNLKAQKGSFDFKTKLKTIEVKISEYMNEVVKNDLTLEKSLGEPNLYFDIEEFILYQQLNKQKILLSEMGSGSNWLNCHIALTLGLHKYISLNETKIPSFLFYDQPSQVYFPSENDMKEENSESDLETVKNIFKKIIENINVMNNDKNCKCKVQLFITDHVDFPDKWFKDCLIEDGVWNKNHKLIPKEYEE